MAVGNDPATIAELERRVSALRPDSQRGWGTMTVDQMLWHVSEALEMAYGEKAAASKNKGLIGRLIKFMALYGPWPKGRMPTVKELRVTGSHDFEAERSRLLRLLGRLERRREFAKEHPTFGPTDATQWIRLQVRHVSYHLSQFDV